MPDPCILTVGLVAARDVRFQGGKMRARMQAGLSETRVADKLKVNSRETTTVTLPNHLWGKDRQAHFDYLNTKYFGDVNNQPAGWTWHHMGFGGRMQLVPRGLHSAIDHVGGMAQGHWGTLK